MIVCYVSQACTDETYKQVGIVLLIVAACILVGLGISAWVGRR